VIQSATQTGITTSPWRGYDHQSWQVEGRVGWVLFAVQRTTNAVSTGGL
jgi:hypothetical protein